MLFQQESQKQTQNGGGGEEVKHAKGIVYSQGCANINENR